MLAAWDGTSRLDVRGAVLWREVMAGFTVADLRDGGALFARPFDADDPLATPAGLADELAPGVDLVLLAVARAWAALEGAGVDPAAPPRRRAVGRSGATSGVPVPGGCEVEGLANVLAPMGALPAASLAPEPAQAEPVAGRTERTGLRHGGYQVTYGTSFLMAVELLPDGPRAIGVLAYGQRDDPESADTKASICAYAAGEMRPLRFTDAEIEADPELTRRTVTG